MRKLTKVCMIIFTCLSFLHGNAQSVSLKGGLNLASILEKDNSVIYSNDYSYNPGFHLGLAFDLPVVDWFAIEYGLFVSKKGARLINKTGEVDITTSLNLYYLDLPLILKLKKNLSENKKIYFGFGAYTGTGIAGHTRVIGYTQAGAGTNREEIKWGNQNKAVLRRMGGGLIFTGGFEIKKYTVGVSYDLGTINVSSYHEVGGIVKNRVLKLSVGYRFFGKQ